jgi:DNA-binding NarL/FixJ family response regulator
MLTERERVVLHHMMEGHCAAQIADVECVSLATVRTHIRSILWKLDVKSQLAAVAYVRRMQIPCPDERRRTVEEVLVGGTLTTTNHT